MVIRVKAKCPKCKKRRQYSSEKPPTHTPYCDDCFVPLFVDQVEIFKDKTLKRKTKNK